MYRSVELSKKISGEKLLGVLIKAANSINAKTIVRDNYLTLNRLESGDGVREDKFYDGTDIILLSNFFHLPLAFVYGIEKGEKTLDFGIRTGISMPFPYCFGFASKKKIKKYLASVSRIIDRESED